VSDERRAWIALAGTPGIGDGIFGRLIAEFRSAAGVLAAVRDGRVDDFLARWRRTVGRPLLGRRAQDQLRRTALQPDARLLDLDELGLWTLTPLDRDYPERLRDLDPPPLTIHGLGDPASLRQQRSVAVVGTRRPTGTGRALTTRICARLVEAGATIVSGLAVGIDGAAHAATVERDGRTVAVIGAGHRSPGPRAHVRLRREILERGGAIVSEHHPTTEARKGTFPRRNRIIAALGIATIVVEAPAISGALITAHRALDLGRLVLVVPGRPGDWAVTGSLRLLRDTPARPLVGLDEMLEDLGYLGAPGTDGGAIERFSPELALQMLGASEQVVARRLLEGPVGLDALVAETGLAPAVASSAVTLLLMRGWAQPVGPAYIAAGALAR
jgi:DNA processing protein